MKLARVLTAVAVIAAIVSFSHIEALALSHGQPIWDARFLPVSVDGLLVVASLTLLAEARAQQPAPGLARAGLVLGVIPTVAANVVFGVHAGPVGAVISAWPAVSFIVATEILVGQMRRAGSIPTPETVGQTVAAGRARGRAPKRNVRTPERIFADEISRGELPSLRAVKARAKCGTDHARTIREQLAEVLQEVPEAA